MEGPFFMTADKSAVKIGPRPTLKYIADNYTQIPLLSRHCYGAPTAKMTKGTPTKRMVMMTNTAVR